MKKLLAVLATGFLAAGAGAVEEPEPPTGEEESVQLQFVPPPMEGTISLGVYDRDGGLVRVLHHAASTHEFAIGLNGLITGWDGRDADGQPVAPGQFEARGVVVGDLGIEGEAFHGNDWITDDTSPRLRRITALGARPDGSLMMLAEESAGRLALVLCDAAGDIVWHQLLPEDVDPAQLAVTPRHAYIVRNGRLVQLSVPEGPAEVWESEGVTQIAAHDSRVAAVEGGMVKVRSDEGQVIDETEAGGEIAALAVRNGDVVAARDGKLVRRMNGKWEVLELPSLERAAHFAFGSGGTLWVVDGGTDEVKEYSLEGEFLRRLGAAADSPRPLAISPADENRLFLLEEAEGMQQVRGLQLIASRREEGPGAEAVSTWQIFLSRVIQRSETPDAAMIPDLATAESVEIKLRANPLVAGDSETVRVVMGRDGNSTVLQLADGLPLRMIAETPNLRWAALGRRGGEKDAVTIIQSDGSVIEEYVVRRPSNMMRFTCGEFEYPPPPPAEEMEVEISEKEEEEGGVGGS